MARRKGKYCFVQLCVCARVRAHAQAELKCRAIFVPNLEIYRYGTFHKRMQLAFSLPHCCSQRDAVTSWFLSVSSLGGIVHMLFTVVYLTLLIIETISHLDFSMPVRKI